MRDILDMIRMGFLVIAVALASLPSSCQQEAFDTEKYESYVLYDCHLECLDWETEANASVVYANRTYNVTFCKVKGEPEDQFIYANIADLTPFSPSGWFVLQNPENYVDIWSEWTVKEIQIYTEEEVEAESSGAYTQNIIATTANQVCAQELSRMNRVESADPSTETPSVRLSELRIRVIFQESEVIVWNSNVEYRRDSETGEIMVYIATDATQWEGRYAPNGELLPGIYFNYEMTLLTDLPYLEEFLLEARETYLETK